MKYNVTINETLARTLQVEADSQRNAELTISRLYYNNDIVLSADDYLSTEIIVDRNQPYYKSPSHDF
ncbi:MAG: DpnD/PcfM family protein, partial [Prevotella sp.]|nr:DpnD/PcfM family protein [Prevotella sp.]